MRLTLLVTIAVWLTAATAAQAHMAPRTKPVKQMTPKTEYRYGVGNASHARWAIRHYQLVIRWFKANRLATLYSKDPYTRFVAHSALGRARASLKDHRWLLRQAESWRDEGWQRLHPLPAIPHLQGWLCIHSHEGAWDDSGDPYWGGLQMDRGFMRTYGSDFIARFHGLANVWPVWAQMTAAERAYAGYDWRGQYVGHRGYGPWPNTARYCGLL